MSCYSESAVVWHGCAQLHTLYILANFSTLAAHGRADCRTSIDQIVAANGQIVVHIPPIFISLTTPGYRGARVTDWRILLHFTGKFSSET